MHLKKNNKGMTLIELLITIAIIAILSIIIGFSINKISGNRAKTFADDLSSMISRCRVAALSGTTSPKITFSADKVEYTEKEGSGDVVKKTLSTNGVTVTKYKVNDVVTFNAQTGAASTTEEKAQIRIEGGGQTYQIDIQKATGHHTVTRQ